MNVSSYSEYADLTSATTAVRFHSQTYKPRAGGITVGDEPLSGKAEAETGWR
jgi:hypothetical protein